MKKILTSLLVLSPTAALAHPGHGMDVGVLAGAAHPFSGLDHIAVMIAVGLWAALKGGRALWLWPAIFVGVMLVGGVLGMAHVPVPFVEPGILASVVVLGLMVALAIDLPLWLGATLIGVVAVFHGHAHGAEVPENIGGVDYMIGFALATVTLHLVGIAAALGLRSVRLQPLVRMAGAACVVVGLGLSLKLI